MALRVALVSAIASTCTNALSMVNSLANDDVPGGDIYYPASTKVERVAWNDRTLLPDENDAPVVFSHAEYVPWKLCDVKVHSNLADLGPDYGGEQSLRYKKVAKGMDADGNTVNVDLVVTVNSSYSSHDVTRNGLVSEDSCFGVINVETSTSVDLLFSFYATGTNNSVALNKFFFTVYDLDTNEGQKAKEVSTFYHRVNDVFYEPDCSLEISGELATGLTFTASEFGTGADNPQHPNMLTPNQKKRAVMAEFLEKSQWKITFGVLGSGSGGRNFVFAGMSNLFPDSPTSAPTMATTTTSPYKDSTTLSGQDSNTGSSTTTTCITQSCQVYADPHVSGFDNNDNVGPKYLVLSGGKSRMAIGARTFDQRPVDVDAFETGDFWLVKSEPVFIQARFRLSGEFVPDRAAIGAVAVGGPFLRGHKLIVEPLDGAVTLDGVALPDGTSAHHDELVAVTQNMKSGDVTAELPSHVTLTCKRLAHHIDVKITMPPLAGGVDGECGNYDGIAENDETQDVLGRMGDLSVDDSDMLFTTKFAD